MMLKKRFLIPGLLLLVILAGPRPNYPAFDGKIPKLEMTLEQLDAYVKQKDLDVPNLKPDNESRILWADSLRRTEYSVVYLHGWSATWKEGEPIQQALAERYGLNIYLPLLAGHGQADSSSFKNLTPKELIDSAKEALAIGKILGEKVILLSTSTGGTLSAYLAAEAPEDVHAQIMFSPNIDIEDWTSELLTAPWGKQLTRLIAGEVHSFVPPPGAEQYWTTAYSSDGLICLKSLIESTMTKTTWRKINQPTFVGYYFKNEAECDKVVSVEAIKKYFENIATQDHLKQIRAFPNGNHCLVSAFHIQDLEPMKKATFTFVEDVLNIPAK